MKVGFVGAGNMAAAIARGWSRSEDGPGDLVLTDAGSGRARALAAELGAATADDNRQLAESADLLVLAMKPSGLAEVAAEVRDAGKPVISLLGAVSLERLREELPGLPVIRLMPNVAVEVGRGVLCWTGSQEADQELRQRVVALLAPLGTVVELEDRLIDAAAAVMSCSPAYVALFAEALVDAGVREGLPEEEAKLVVTATFAGTAALLGEHDTLTVRRSVTSPGGSTAAGLEALERGAVRAAIAEAVEASLARMRG
jgi:pyrroline-5-carboxylate reductase